MILLNIFDYLGRFHPLVVHLPIGFLVLAVVFDLLTYKDSFQNLRSSVPVILLLSGIAATISCILGWMLSKTGDYDYLTLRNHQYSGISVAIISFLFYFFKTSFFQNFILIQDKTFRFLLILLNILLIYVGHQGGNLTHGSDYLSLGHLTESKKKKPKSLDQAKVFEDLVLPILQDKCQQCHQKSKKKGDLLMLSYTDLLKGGKNGPVIVAGSSAKSEMYRRVTLDPKHEEFMPADGKSAMTNEEIKVLKWWLDEAKGAENVAFKSAPNFEKMTATAFAVLGIGGVVLTESSKKIKVELNPEIPKKADKKAIETAIKGGFNIRLMNRNPDMLDVSFVDKKASPNLNLLKPFAENIVWLTLNQLNLGNEIGKNISEMKNLEKLRLDKNNVSDGIVQHFSNLKHLNSINLNETKITVNAISELKKLGNLKNIYAWRTAINEMQFSVVNDDSNSAKVVFK